MRILFIHAHPDDVEILAGGTVALLATQGHDITIATMTPGDCGARERGAGRDCRDTAARSHLGGRADRRQVYVRGVSRLRRVQRRPFPPARHRTAAPCAAGAGADRFTRRLHVRPRGRQRAGARLPALSPLRRTTRPAFPTPRRRSKPSRCLYFMDPVAGVDRDDRVVIPDFIVDVSSTFARKQRMLAAAPQPARMAGRASRSRRLPGT